MKFRDYLSSNLILFNSLWKVSIALKKILKYIFFDISKFEANSFLNKIGI